MTIPQNYDHAFFKDLAALLTGQIILPEDETYEQVRQVWNGVLTPLRAFGKPLADQIQPITYDTLVHSADALFPQGRHYFSRTQSLDGLRAETIEGLVESAQRFSSSRVSASATAFAPRQDHLMVEIVAGWEPQSPEADQRHVQWTQASSDALAPYALKGGYINLLDEGEQERVPLTLVNVPNMPELSMEMTGNGQYKCKRTPRS